MSSVAFGALTTRRENSASGTSKSVEPPGLNSHIDILTGLVPAEVLAIHALVLSIVATSNSKGQTQIIDATTARWAFWLLLALVPPLARARPRQGRAREAANLADIDRPHTFQSGG